MPAVVILCQQKRHRAVPMPISANATITALTVAETIATSLTFIIKRCCERTIVAHAKQNVCWRCRYQNLKFLAGYVKYGFFL